MLMQEEIKAIKVKLNINLKYLFIIVSPKII